MPLRCSAIVLAAVAAVALTGCAPKMTVAEMKDQMPKRPAELDRLNMFVGHWEGTGECRMEMLDEPLKTQGVSEIQWAGDNWYLVEQGRFTMGDFEPMKGLGTWSYDTHAKKYRSTWVDSMGSTGLGEATYDEKTGTWKWSGDTYGPWGKSRISGTLKFPDENTMEWTMAEHMGLAKTMEMKGTSKRVK